MLLRGSGDVVDVRNAELGAQVPGVGRYGGEMVNPSSRISHLDLIHTSFADCTDLFAILSVLLYACLVVSLSELVT